MRVCVCACVCVCVCVCMCACVCMLMLINILIIIPLFDLSRILLTAVSTLVDSSQVTDHLHTDYVQDSGQFSVESRPGCVRSLYGQADLSPVEAIRSCDKYRTDGRSGSQLFLVSPVILQEDHESPDLGASHKVCLTALTFPAMSAGYGFANAFLRTHNVAL